MQNPSKVGGRVERGERERGREEREGENENTQTEGEETKEEKAVNSLELKVFKSERVHQGPPSWKKTPRNFKNSDKDDQFPKRKNKQTK